MLQIVLLAGKFLFLIILFLFIYRVIRSSTRELRTAAPGSAAKQYAAPPVAAATLETPSTPYAASLGGGGVWTLVVERSPALRPGEAYTFEAGIPALVGRSSDMDIHLDDTFVSSKHVLFEATPSGLLAEDLLSTNGTQVNGADISQPTLLSPGDRVEVGDTIFRVEVR
jgi:hypothetical protein